MSRISIVFLLALTWAFAACADTGENRYQPTASALLRLARAVDTYVADRPQAAAMSSDALLAAATEHNPRLLDPFTRYDLRARAEQRSSSVLVCEAEGAVVEDAGCTPFTDFPAWRAQPRPACRFSLNLVQVCGL